MELNPNIGLQIKPVQVNPLGMMGNALNLARQTYQVRQQKAQQAIGNALQRSVGANGRINPMLAGQAIAANPNAAMDAGQGFAQVQALQHQHLANLGAQLTNRGLNLANAQKTQSLVANTVGALASKPDLSIADVKNAGSELVSLHVPPGEVASVMATMPRDPEKLRAWVTEVGLRAVHAATQLARIQAATQSGAPINETYGQAAYGGPIIGATPEVVSAQNTAGAGEGKAAITTTYTDLQGINKQNAAYAQVLANLKDADTGPQAEHVAKLNTLFAEAGLPADVSQAQSYQELEKNLTQATLQSGSGLGIGSDMQLSTNLAANPSAQMLPQTIKTIVRWNMGLNNYKLAMAHSIQAEVAQNPAAATQARMDFQEKYPAAVFGYAALPKAEKSAYLAHLAQTSPEAYQEFMIAAHNVAINHLLPQSELSPK